LDKDEMRVLLTDLKIESTEKVLKMIFDKFDKNLSDSIDFEEFIEVGIWIHNELPKQKLN
jgi:Ca2+-binding EF-hand superfamily protein